MSWIVTLLCLLFLAPQRTFSQSDPAQEPTPNHYKIDSGGITGQILFRDTIPVGDTIAGILRIHNSGPTQHLVDSVLVRVPIGITDSLLVRTDIPIPANDSVDLIFYATIPVRAQSFILAKIEDEWQPARPLTAVPKCAYWSNKTIQVDYCERILPLTVTIRNLFDSLGMIDSVITLTEGWNIEPELMNVQVMPRTNITPKVRNSISASREGVFVLYPHDALPDTMRVVIDAPSYIPKLDPEGDTTYVDVNIDESTTVVLLAKNEGKGMYRIRGVNYVPSEFWTLEPIDTTQSILRGAPAQIFLHFLGRPTEGDFPITIALQPNDCDDSIAKTVTARVRKPSAVSQDPALHVAVWPQPVHDHLLISASAAFEFELLDILGTIRLSGKSADSVTDLRLTSFDPGTYILRCKIGSSYISRTVSLIR